MKTKFSIIAVALAAMTLASCGDNGGGGELSGTALAVSEASKMTKAELEAASQKEWQDNPNGVFKVVGLTSVLKSIATTVASRYEWLTYGQETGNNIDVNNGYKDYQLLTALNSADKKYFADYALVQDARYFSTYIEDGICHNFVPKDWQEIGLNEKGILPLNGVHFNKLFWTNTNFEHITGKKLYNIWQLAGVAGDHPDHLSKLSFQTPKTEQINMSFLVSAYAESNQARIEKAYKDYYGKDWSSETYHSAGEQWVTELMTNVTRWHASDGTAMKETQLRDDWNEGYVYYGAFAKMKDAVSKFYNTADLNGDGTVAADESVTVTCDDKSYTYSNADNSGKGPCAMDTVKWDWEINGFNGFMYCMDSQVINNAKYPYTACLFARVMLEEEAYTAAIYNANNPDAEGRPANQYGYYYPGTASSEFRYAKGDWTKEQHYERELVEDYAYLKDVKMSVVNYISSLVA